MANEVNITVRTRDQATKPMSGIKSAFKGMLTAGAAFAAFDIFKGMIADARESEKVTKQTNAVIKSTGGIANVTASQVSKLATAISNKTGVDDEAIQTSSNLLLTFKGVRNEVGKGNDIFNQAQKAIVDMTAAMHNGEVTTDGLKQSTIQVGKALNDPIKGLTALSRVGVTFSDRQKEMIRHFVEIGDKASAQKIILKELASEFGGSAAASATAVDKLKVKLGNLGEDIASKALPYIDEAATALGRMVDFGERNKEWLGPVTGGFIGLAAAIKAVAVAQALANSAALKNPYVAVAAAIIALAVAFTVAWKKSQTFRNIMVDVATTTAQVFIRIGEVITNAILGAFNAVVQGAAKAFGWIPGIGGRIKKSAQDIQKWKDGVVGSFDHASDAVERWGDRIKNAPKVAKVRGDIVDLTRKLAQARSDLKRTHNQQTRAKVQANISQLEAALRRAKAELASLKDKTVYVTTVLNKKYGYNPDAFAHGGIIGAASGGPRSRTTLVGEAGPELVDLPPGSNVRSNPDTRRMLGQQGGAMTVTLEFAGSPGNGLDTLFWDWLKKNVRLRGGKGSSSVQKALGS